jgi:hypothetical protein
MQNLLCTVVEWSVLVFHSQRWIAVRVQVQRQLYNNSDHKSISATLAYCGCTLNVPFFTAPQKPSTGIRVSPVSDSVFWRAALGGGAGAGVD